VQPKYRFREENLNWIPRNPMETCNFARVFRDTGSVAGLPSRGAPSHGQRDFHRVCRRGDCGRMARIRPFENFMPSNGIAAELHGIARFENYSAEKPEAAD
jgi:hypothetical protein